MILTVKLFCFIFPKAPKLHIVYLFHRIKTKILHFDVTDENCDFLIRENDFHPISRRSTNSVARNVHEMNPRIGRFFFLRKISNFRVNKEKIQRGKRAKRNNCLISNTMCCSFVVAIKSSTLCIKSSITASITRMKFRKWARARTHLRKFWGVKLLGKWVILRIMENAGSGREECTGSVNIVLTRV